MISCSVRSATCRLRRASREVLCNKLCGATSRVELRAWCKVLCDKLRSYAVRSNDGTLEALCDKLRSYAVQSNGGTL